MTFQRDSSFSLHEFGASQHIADFQSDGIRRMHGNQFVIPGDDPQLHAMFGEVGNGLDDIRFGGSKKSRKPTKIIRLFIFNDIISVLSGHRFLGDAQNPKSLIAPGCKALMDAVQDSGVQGLHDRVDLNLVADIKYIAQGAFHDQGTISVLPEQ